MDLEPAVDLIVVDTRTGPDATATASLAAAELFILRFRLHRLDLECCTGELGCLCLNGCIDTQIGQSPTYNAARKPEVLDTS